MPRDSHHNATDLFDALEKRCLLSAVLTPEGVLQLDGTSSIDAIVVRAGADDGQVVVTGVDGVNDGTVFSGVRSLRIRLFQGDDRAEVVGRLTTAAGKPMRVRIAGNAGNDTLIGGNTFDTIFGGAGNDIIRGGGLGDKLHGGPGNDRISGNRGRDTLTGSGGRDILRGDIGDDVIRGNSGNDKLFGGPGNDDLFGGFGNDELRGNRGNDDLHGGIGHDDLFGDLGRDTLRGDSGDDFLSGGAGDDLLEGGTGDDDLRGNRGNDTLNGGSDDDLLDGGDGNDRLRGGTGDDTLHGGSGDDDLDGGPGTDSVFGDDGSDSFHGHKSEWEDHSSDDDRFDDDPNEHRSLDDDFWSFLNRLEINLGGSLPPEVDELVNAAQDLNFHIGNELHDARDAIRDNLNEDLISLLIGIDKPFEGAGDAVLETLEAIFGDDPFLIDFDLDNVLLDFDDLVLAYERLRPLLPVSIVSTVDAAIDAINQHPAEIQRLELAFDDMLRLDQPFIDALIDAALSDDDNHGGGGSGARLDDDFLSMIVRLESNLGGTVPQQVETLIAAARTLNTFVRADMDAAREVVRDNLDRSVIISTIGIKKPFEGAGEAIAETLESIFSNDLKLTDFDNDGARLDFDDVVTGYEMLVPLLPADLVSSLIASADGLTSHPAETQAVEDAFDALFTLDQTFLNALRDAVRFDD